MSCLTVTDIDGLQRSRATLPLIRSLNSCVWVGACMAPPSRGTSHISPPVLESHYLVHLALYRTRCRVSALSRLDIVIYRPLEHYCSRAAPWTNQAEIPVFIRWVLSRVHVTDTVLERFASFTNWEKPYHRQGPPLDATKAVHGYVVVIVRFRRCISMFGAP